MFKTLVKNLNATLTELTLERKNHFNKNKIMHNFYYQGLQQLYVGGRGNAIPNGGGAAVASTVAGGGGLRRGASAPKLYESYDRQRKWTKIINPGQNWQPPESEQFKLMSYNILAQDLLQTHIYLYFDIDPNYLRWDRRQCVLLQEIQKINPDILCLQEMQVTHLKAFVNQMKDHQRRLEYIFKKKTGFRSDGCAIIYDRDKFCLISEQTVEYNVNGAPLLDRPNIALLAKFKLRRKPTKEFVVATTHLLYNPKRDDVRLAQASILQKALVSFACDKDKNLPVILTGDFNAQRMDMTMLSLQQPTHLYDEEGAIQTSLQLTPLTCGHHSASTFQNGWITVDYILYANGSDNRKIIINRIYELVPRKTLFERGLIPNNFLGSDHYSLAMSFSLK